MIVMGFSGVSVGNPNTKCTEGLRGNGQFRVPQVLHCVLCAAIGPEFRHGSGSDKMGGTRSPTS